jgi:hypothetical protein
VKILHLNYLDGTSPLPSFLFEVSVHQLCSLLFGALVTRCDIMPPNAPDPESQQQQLDDLGNGATDAPNPGADEQRTGGDNASPIIRPNQVCMNNFGMSLKI